MFGWSHNAFSISENWVILYAKYLLKICLECFVSGFGLRFQW